MNKGIEALERLREHLDYDTYYQYTNKEDLGIIEKELKRCEALKKAYKDLVYQTRKLEEERNKALEILKLVKDTLHPKLDYSTPIGEHLVIGSGRIINQEEYDLLKGWLDND